MSAAADHYEVLGVARDATAAQIKAAYRKLSKKHHADAGGSDEVMRVINEAYEVLSDPEKRRRYDEHGDAGFDLEKEAGQALRNLFGKLVKGDFQNVELAKQMRAFVALNMDESRKAAERARAELGRLKRLERRFRRKAGAAGVDPFTAVLEAEVVSVQNDIKQLGLIRKVQDRVLEMLQDYEDIGEDAALIYSFRSSAAGAAGRSVSVSTWAMDEMDFGGRHPTTGQRENLSDILPP